MTNNKAREINSPVIKQLIDETSPEELAKIDTEMKNDKQTAVDWVTIEIIDLYYHIKEFDINNKEHRKLIMNALKRAKQIEKEQIAKAFDDGDYNYHYSRKTGDDFEDGKEYFNEVYG